MNSTQLKSEFNPENYSTQLNSNQVSTLLPARRASLLLASPLGRASVAYFSGHFTEARIGRLRRELKLLFTTEGVFLLLFGALCIAGRKPPLIASMMMEVTWMMWWPFWTFSRRFRDSPEDAFWGTSGAPGELIWGRIGAHCGRFGAHFQSSVRFVTQLTSQLNLISPIDTTRGSTQLNSTPTSTQRSSFH